MSTSIFETHADEHGNITVRISQEVQVLTYEEADRIASEYKRMRTESEKLRELLRDFYMLDYHGRDCTECPKSIYDRCTGDGGCDGLSIVAEMARELGVFLDG